jgi:hypothetical protein
MICMTDMYDRYRYVSRRITEMRAALVAALAEIKCPPPSGRCVYVFYVCLLCVCVCVCVCVCLCVCSPRPQFTYLLVV